MSPNADNIITMITTPTKITEQEITMASTSPLLRELVAETHKHKHEHKHKQGSLHTHGNDISCVPLEGLESVVMPCTDTEITVRGYCLIKVWYNARLEPGVTTRT